MVKKKRRIGRERFLYLCNCINLLNSIIHSEFEDDEFTSLPYVYDDNNNLSEDIEKLKVYILKFEKKHNLKLDVNIDFDSE